MTKIVIASPTKARAESGTMRASRWTPVTMVATAPVPARSARAGIGNAQDYSCRVGKAVDGRCDGNHPPLRRRRGTFREDMCHLPYAEERERRRRHLRDEIESRSIHDFDEHPARLPGLARLHGNALYSTADGTRHAGALEEGLRRPGRRFGSPGRRLPFLELFPRGDALGIEVGLSLLVLSSHLRGRAELLGPGLELRRIQLNEDGAGVDPVADLNEHALHHRVRGRCQLCCTPRYRRQPSDHAYLARDRVLEDGADRHGHLNLGDCRAVATRRPTGGERQHWGGQKSELH